MHNKLIPLMHKTIMSPSFCRHVSTYAFLVVDILLQDLLHRSSSSSQIIGNICDEQLMSLLNAFYVPQETMFSPGLLSSFNRCHLHQHPLTPNLIAKMT
jgi:hypothetical protein